jgi:hypothetical protein
MKMMWTIPVIISAFLQQYNSAKMDSEFLLFHQKLVLLGYALFLISCCLFGVILWLILG